MEFRILTFNLHHHNDSEDVNAFDEQLDVIAQVQPHLTLLQEVEKGTGYNGGADGVALVKSGLESRWSTPLSVLNSSKTSASSSSNGQHIMAIGKGVTLTLISRTVIAYGFATLLFKVTFNGRTMHFMTFHLQSGQATPSNFRTPEEGMRVSQQVDINYNATNQLVPTSNPRFFVGDFNTLPGQPSLDPMRHWYNDLWATSPDRMQPPRCIDGETYFAGNPPSDVTDYDRRIDYIFYGKKNWSSMSWVRPLRCEVINVFRPDGSQCSDHAPLLGVFDIL